MKLKDIFEIEKHFSKRKTPCDIIEMLEDYDTMQKGLDWFSRNFTKQYYVLLD